MIKIKNKSMCSGCHACVNICPKQCIAMASDEEGFLYPVVDKEKCIECGLCEKVCYAINPCKNENLPEVYACYNKDDAVRASSSSGGIFTLFAELILNLNGVIFGAAFDENLVIKHICVDNKEDLHKLRASKYVQSIVGDSYKKAKELLENGRVVLFTGTPCQINGLMSYLGKKYDNLYTQDIICHGVPSSKVWKKYLEYMEKSHGSKVASTINPSFRAKTFGWLNYSVKINFENKTVHDETLKKDLFMRSYLSNALLRPSCYKCASKGLQRISDVTLADFWGVNKVLPEMFDDKGTSLIFLNTEKGKRLFSEVQAQCVFKKTDVDTAVKHNSAAYASPIKPLNRKKVMKNMDRWDFKVIHQECCKKTLLDKIQRKLKRISKS